MSSRINVLKAEPADYKAMMGLETYVESTSINPLHYELIKIRASQINGCAFCLDMHTRDARKGGETEQRIYLLNAWRETSFFTAEERAIFELTEAVTLITKGVSNAVYENAVKVLGDKMT